MIFTVLSHEVDEYRQHFEPVLKQIDGMSDQVTSEDVFRQVASAHAQLWGWAEDGEVKAAVSTRIYEMAKGKLCHIWICIGYGYKDQLLKMHDEIEAWARSMGCYAIEIVGREGWMKDLDGYKKTAVVMEKPLTKVH